MNQAFSVKMEPNEVVVYIKAKRTTPISTTLTEHYWLQLQDYKRFFVWQTDYTKFCNRYFRVSDSRALKVLKMILKVINSQIL